VAPNLGLRMSTPDRIGQKSPARPPLYFVSGMVDSLFIGGLSLMTFAAMQLLATSANDPSYYAVALALAWVCNWPHFAASTYRLYESNDHIRQYPMTALVIPWFILAGIVASFWSPERIAPYWVKLFLVWSPYHFSGQTFGVAMIYARRAGYMLGRWQRLSLTSFIYATFISRTIRLEIGDQTQEYYSMDIPSLGLPEWRFPGREQFLLVDVANAAMWLAAIVFIGFVMVRWLRRGERPPTILFVPLVAQYCWFIGSLSRPGYFEFVPFFHSLQYLFIAWAVRLKGTLDRGAAAPGRRFVISESLFWGLTIFLGGLVLFLLSPYIGQSLGGLSVVVAGGIVTSGIQIHHFFVDGVIWKLRTKSVGSPLMVNLDQLLHPIIGPARSAAA
jgi:hypothetical protein